MKCARNYEPEQITTFMCAMVLIVALVAGCSSKQEEPQGSDSGTNYGILRRGIGGEPSSLDPAAASDTFSSEVMRDLYKGLTTETPDGTVVPGVATAWNVDLSGTRYEFRLRPDARWSNGAPVRAREFVNAWRRVVDPTQGSPVADNLRLLAGAENIIAGRAPPSSLGVSAPRDDILVVTLARPAPYFPELLTHASTFPVYSELAAKSHDPKTWVSNGAYVLNRWIPGGTIQLSKNPAYWDRGHVAISRVEYIPLPDANAELLRYRAGQLDVTQSVPLAELASIRKEQPNELHVAPFLGTVYYAFNLHSAPFKDNAKLRQALVMAVDRRAILSTIEPFDQNPAYGFVPKGTWNYEPQSWAWATWSDAARLSEARRLYAAAGYSKAVPLHLKLLLNANPNIKQLAVAVASMWRESLGIETELIDEEYRVFLDSRKDVSRWDIVRLAWTADYNDAGNFLDTFRTNSPNNDSGFHNARFDELLEEAAKNADPMKRREALESAEQIMLADYPVIPIYFLSSKRLIKPYVHGELPNALNKLYSKHLSIDLARSAQ